VRGGPGSDEMREKETNLLAELFAHQREFKKKNLTNFGGWWKEERKEKSGGGKMSEEGGDFC